MLFKVVLLKVCDDFSKVCKIHLHLISFLSCCFFFNVGYSKLLHLQYIIHITIGGPSFICVSYENLITLHPKIKVQQSLASTINYTSVTCLNQGKFVTHHIHSHSLRTLFLHEASIISVFTVLYVGRFLESKH